MVAGVDEWLEEFLVPADVAAAFSAEGFSGFLLRSVFNSKTKMAHPDVHQLYSNTIMPPAEPGEARAAGSNSGAGGNAPFFMR